MSGEIGIGAISSEIVVAAVTALATWIIAHRNVRTQNIVPERAKWREKIREAATAAARDDPDGWRDLWIVTKLNTNPLDSEDRDLVALTAAEMGEQPSSKRREEILDRVALLLKHDWQRAKREVGDDALAVRRVPYAEFQAARARGDLDRGVRYWSGQLPLT